MRTKILFLTIFALSILVQSSLAQSPTPDRMSLNIQLQASLSNWKVFK